MNTLNTLLSRFLMLGIMVATLPGLVFAKTTSTVIGAMPAPPMGAGPGKMIVLPLRQKDKPVYLTFGDPGTPSGNSFYVAQSKELAYIPSAAGYTDIFNMRTQKRVNQFKTIDGGRVAALSSRNDMVVVLSGKQLAAYSATDGKKRYNVNYGGNAVVFNNDQSRMFVGGNMNDSIAEINTYTGKILNRIPIGHSGDLAWANGFLYSANMKTGVMTAYNPYTQKTISMKTPESDPNFSYHRIAKAHAGFMQLAVSPDQKLVYAAGFSGHILRFSTDKPAYLGEVKISANESGPNKLSGLAIIGKGKQAICSVENLDESIIVDLSNGRIVKRLPNVVSNRWVVATSH